MRSNWGYKMRYPAKSDPEYMVNGVWTKRNNVPERREYEQNYNSTLGRFICRSKNKMEEKNKKWIGQGKYIIGENEFSEKETSNKLMDHYKKQIERYGEVCPITLIKFTTIRTYEKIKERKNMEKHIFFSNLSPDRILNNINYTKQNTLFTAAGWNIARGELALGDFKYLFKDEIIERYKKILIERFPDQGYKDDVR
jgi:hypothetical protein